jgi:hypothetical protein
LRSYSVTSKPVKEIESIDIIMQALNKMLSLHTLN